MWWGKGSDKPTPPKASPAETQGAVDGVKNEVKKVAADVKSAAKDAKDAVKDFDPKLPSREKLPTSLQKIVEKQDKEENFYNELVDGYAAPSTDSNIRYAAYAARARTILLSAHRYVAYTSDIGESFRPVAHPYIVKGAYGISWAYLIGDVSYEGYKAYWHNRRALDPSLRLTERQTKITGLDPDPVLPGAILPPAVTSIPPLEDYRTVMVQRAIFQGLASMGLPAFTIHSVVRYSGRAMKDMKNKTIRTWAPIGLGLAVVPFLPRLFDEPVENAVEWVFHKGFAAYGGKKAVGDAPETGRERLLNKEKKD